MHTRMHARTHACTHAHTHTPTTVLRPCWILFGTTRVSWHLKGKTGKVNQSGFTGARDSEWQLHQLGHVQICTLTQTPLIFFTGQIPFQKENEVALQRAEMRMVRQMCGVKLQDRITSGGMRKLLSSKGKEEKLWKLEKGKIDRGMGGVEEE